MVVSAGEPSPGRYMSTLSRGSKVAFMSWVLAPVTTAESGVPLREIWSAEIALGAGPSASWLAYSHILGEPLGEPFGLVIEGRADPSLALPRLLLDAIQPS
jgi:hypothetical protein